ncbi:MAG TPA: carboxypeptidase regulatory-like domain-containing protein [Candidatus Eisenbacteria bacterium]|nr:carboxypeptidase regulatory-like domain-containing protein [Candidatus Eisenbacteria bacterium]
MVLVRRFGSPLLVALIHLAALSHSSPLPARAAAGSTPPTGEIEVLARLGGRSFYSGCALYTHADGRRYALVAHVDGTSVVEISDATAPREAGFVPGLYARSRDIVVGDGHAYVASPTLGTGVQVIRLADPEHPVLVDTYDQYFDACNGLAIDHARRLLFASGAKFQGSHRGVFVLSLADPGHPVVLGQYEPGATEYVSYQHAALHGERLYVASGGGEILALDVSNPAAPARISSWGYAASYRTRGVALSSRGTHLYATDAGQAQPLRVFALGAVAKGVAPLVHELQLPAPLFPYGAEVAGDVAYVASLGGGLGLYDLADPANPAEFARFDPYTGLDGGLHGIADVAVLGDGWFVTTSIEEGLMICRSRASYGTLRIEVLDARGRPVRSARVRHGSSLHGPQASGVLRFAAPPGAVVASVEAFGFEPATIAAELAEGEHASFTLRLRPLPMSTVAGIVRDAADGTPIMGARIEVEGDGDLRFASWEEGRYDLVGLPAGTHRVRCERDGFIPQERTISVAGGETRALDWSLRRPDVYLPVGATPEPWSTRAPGDDAPIGRWIATSPSLPLVYEGISLAPFGNHTDTGGNCYQTADQGLSFWPVVTVQQGRTTLTSPSISVAGMADPIVAYWSWFAFGVPDEPEALVVSLSADGVNFVTVDVLSRSDPAWRYREVRVAEWLQSAATVWIRFMASDYGAPSYATAAIDDVMAFDGASRIAAPIEEGPGSGASASGVRLEHPYPSPTRGAALVLVRLPVAAPVRADLYDVKGRLVAPLHDGPAPAGTFGVRWNGETRQGEPAGSGVYFVRVRGPGFDRTARVVKVK